MALKLRLKKADYDKLHEEVKKEYIPDGDDFRLDHDGEDTGALRRAKDRETQLRKEAEAARDELSEKVEKLERGKAGDVTRLQKQWDGEKETLVKTHGEVLSKKDAFITTTLKGGLAERIAATLNPRAPKVFIPHVASRISVDLSGDEPKVVILDKDGKASTLKPEDLQKEFVANKDFAGMIVGSQASGGAGPGQNKNNGGGASGSNGNDGDKPPDLSRMNPRDFVARIKANKEAAASNE